MITFFLHPSSKSIIDHIICIDLTTLKPHSYIMIIWSHIWTKTTHGPVNNDTKCKRYPTVLIIYTQLGKKLIYLILICHCQTDSGISKSARLMSKVAIFHKIWLYKICNLGLILSLQRTPHGLYLQVSYGKSIWKFKSNIFKIMIWNMGFIIMKKVLYHKNLPHVSLYEQRT